MQDLSKFINYFDQYYLRPIIDFLIIKKPYYIHLARNLRAGSEQNLNRNSSNDSHNCLKITGLVQMYMETHLFRMEIILEDVI